MLVKEVPMLEDNYGYILVDEATKQAAAIDPVELDKVLAAVEALGATVTVVLTTHKHWDHAGGNNAMKKCLPDVPILGGAIDQVEGCTRALQDGEELTLGNDVRIRCLHTPGHTMGHICYYATSSSGEGETNKGAVFTGDTLFVGGAGKFFEGSPSDMHGSLYGKLAALPADTLVYCGHEYTLANYKFAQWVEPENAELQAAVADAQQRRAQGQPTVPSTIGKELATNPFLRVGEAAVRAKVEGGEGMGPEGVLGALREMKNGFKG